MLDLKNYSKLSALWILQSLIALTWLLLIPTEAGGYTMYRILLVSFHVVLTAFFIALAFKYRTFGWESLASHPRLFNFLYLIAIIFFLLPLFVIFVLYGLGHSVGNIYITYAERISPFAFLISAVGLEWWLWHVAVKKTDLSMFRRILMSTLKVLLWILPIFVIPFLTKWGSSANSGWFFR